MCPSPAQACCKGRASPGLLGPYQGAGGSAGAGAGAATDVPERPVSRVAFPSAWSVWPMRICSRLSHACFSCWQIITTLPSRCSFPAVWRVRVRVADREPCVPRASRVRGSWGQTSTWHPPRLTTPTSVSCADVCGLSDREAGVCACTSKALGCWTQWGETDRTMDAAMNRMIAAVKLVVPLVCATALRMCAPPEGPQPAYHLRTPYWHSELFCAMEA